MMRPPLSIFQSMMNRLGHHWFGSAKDLGRIYDGIERRSYPRVKCHHLVKCVYVNGERCGWVTNLTNLSEGGLKMRCPDLLQRNDILKLLINFLRWDINLVVAVDLVWIRPVTDGPGFDAGFSFLETASPYDHSVIRQYVSHRLRHRF